MCEKGLLLLSPGPQDDRKEMVRWGGGWTNSRTASLGDPVKPEGGPSRKKRRGCSGNNCFGEEMYELNLGDHSPLLADSAGPRNHHWVRVKSIEKDKGMHRLGQGVKKRQTSYL